ncbi:ZYRO0A06886p [Zygosaccharomyces rouxii]|uniref:ZYRO0A06886p n=1 Tax=Zygosaccharomyces rouxii (strain ATCC 2623 / CBS 732 / NBRC 1130 / NCYC 568 / NRRL Y-229) TaxID=559307 RepID=C5DPX3_ZYGRC|nr:uncharacterized protein ZYRO0A06886g [Zygosaccharomyces rouxii]KAH9198745.1 P-loop containing nucleoside triphosphate hydrolase protein [Zygosaccharomyces rouxii]CAR25734.1 ZYRO0A06886p [Zygosaccharomyces rouxii]
MMSLWTKRWFSTTSSLTNRAADIGKIVLNTKVQQPFKSDGGRKQRQVAKTKKPARDSNPPAWYTLNQKYSSLFSEPSATEINSVNHFFNSSDVRYEWSAAHFIDVPGERLKEKVSNESNGKKFQGKTYVPFELVNGLPEVAFLGKSNAGKSTLLNSLTTDLKQTSLGEYARASKRAGFTKTLNSFNIGNKFRIVDTPGYGYNSSAEQGNLTMEYVSQRQQLARCFLLISGEQGFNDMDLQIVEFLSSIGKPFEIVFTKMDKVKDLKGFQNMNLHELPGLPGIIFTNSLISKTCPKRYGVDLLRRLIFQSCGLQIGTKPSRQRK